MIVCCQVIRDVVNDCIRRQGADMIGENTAECMPIMIWNTLTIDFTGGGIQKGNQVGGAVSFVVEVFKDRLTCCCGQIRSQALECLNACTFIETEQIFGPIQIQGNDKFHFGEKIRIGYLQLVLAPLRL